VQRLTKKLALALAVAVVIGVIPLAATGRIGILRFGLVAAACLLLPGLGWARRSQLRDAGDRLALGIGISICAVTLVGTTMAVSDKWSMPAGAVGLLAVAVTGFLPLGLLKAIGAGLKWFINLFAGPATHPAIRMPDDRSVAEADRRTRAISEEDRRSPSAPGTLH
jgi:hypothetical protein